MTGTTRLRNGATIAKAHVERTLKGPTFETVFYQVDLRMLEDVSTAHVGERVLLFLYRPTLRSPDRYPKEIKRVTGGSPLFMIYHLGRGRLVTLRSGNKEYLQFRRGSPIILPEEIPVTWGFEASDPDLGSVGLEDFMKYIVKQTAGEQRVDCALKRLSMAEPSLDYALKKSRYFAKNVEMFPNSLRVLQNDEWTPQMAGAFMKACSPPSD